LRLPQIAPVMNPVQVDENRQRRLGGFASIAEGLDFAALGSASVHFYDARGQAATVLSYADLRGRACQIAMALRARGLARSDVIVLLSETSAEFLCTFYACQYAGVVPCPVPPLRPRSAAHAFDFVKQIAAESGARAIVGPGNAVANLANALPPGISLLSFEDLATAGGRSGDEVREVCDTAYIQYSSGSTARPKGVIVTQKAVM